MTLVDSSGWIEFFVDGPLARRYGAYLAQPAAIITPTLVLYEVYKKIRRDRTEEHALIAAAQLHKTTLVPLTSTLALSAADLSLEHGLAMADAVVYATARAYQATLVTSDDDFARLPGVTYLKRP